MTFKKPIILFDGVCNLCNNSVRFVLKRDTKRQFSYVPLQSEEGKSLLNKYRIPEETDSIVLIKDEKYYIESDAVLEICEHLPLPWHLARTFKILPLNWRDTIYRWVAKNRYRWFGRREEVTRIGRRTSTPMCPTTGI